MMTQAPLTTEVPADRRVSKPEPLGPPHDAIAAAGAALGWAAALFFLGAQNVLGGGAWIGFGIAFVVAIASQSYFVRAYSTRFSVTTSTPGVLAFTLLAVVLIGGSFIFQRALYEIAQTQLLLYALACLAFTTVAFGLMAAFMRAYVRRNAPVAQSH